MGPRYEPTSGEVDRFREIVARLTPDYADYETYRARVRALRDDRRRRGGCILVLGGIEARVTRFGLCTSYLFRQRHLLAELPAPAFKRLAPGAAGVTRLTTTRDGLPLPLVVIPSTLGWSQRMEFRSIIEREFVHVNRWISAQSEEPEPHPESPAELLDSFMLHAAREYEASVVQFTRWPALFVAHREMSLNLWCALDAFAGSLRWLILEASQLDQSGMRWLLDALVDAADRALQPAALQSGEIRYLGGLVHAHLGSARRRVLEDMPELAKRPAMETLRSWMAGGPPLETGSARTAREATR